MAELIFVLVWVTFSNKILMLFSFQGVEPGWMISVLAIVIIGWEWPGSRDHWGAEESWDPDSIQMWRGECDNDELEASPGRVNLSPDLKMLLNTKT